MDAEREEGGGREAQKKTTQEMCSAGLQAKGEEAGSHEEMMQSGDHVSGPMTAQLRGA